MLTVHEGISVATYHETILTTYVFSMHTHLSICVLMFLSSYPSMHGTYRVGADTFSEHNVSCICRWQLDELGEAHGGYD